LIVSTLYSKPDRDSVHNARQNDGFEYKVGLIKVLRAGGVGAGGV